MKTLTLSLCAVAAMASAALANATVSSTVQQDFVVTFERQSGETKTATLSKGSSTPGYTSIETPDKGTTPVSVADATGAVVAKGKVTDNGHYVLLPKGDGFVLTSAGTLSGPWVMYPGVVIVNTLPEAYTVDLFGHSGKVGVKAQKPSKAMDAKSAIKLPAGDDRFKAVIHLPDGTTVDSQSSVSLGWYHVIHKTYDDKITISTLGYIENQDPKKKKK